LGGGVFGLKNMLDLQFQPWMLGVISSGYFLFGSFGELLSPKICQILHGNYALVLFINRLIQGTFLFFLAFQTGFVGFASLYFIMTAGYS